MIDLNFEEIIDKTVEHNRCIRTMFLHMATLTPDFDYASDGSISTEVIYNAIQESFLEASKTYPTLCTADYFAANLEAFYAVMYYYIAQFVTGYAASGAVPVFSEKELAAAEKEGLPNPSFVTLLSYKVLECFKDAGRPANATLH
jgi:hypothetical protein